MKIFSLQTKKHLVGWSVALSFVIALIQFILSKIVAVRNNCTVTAEAGCLYDLQTKVNLDFGWPFKHHNYPHLYQFLDPALKIVLEQYSFFLNILFWTTVLIIILSLIRYLRAKH